MTNEQKRSRREHLTSTTDKGKIELTEQKLSRVVGGIDDKVGSLASVAVKIISW